MHFCYETNRLYLKALQENAAPQVLDFYQRSREAFERWEPDRSASFYAPAHQAALLRWEFQLILKQAALRLWVFRKEDPGVIIGTISFQEIRRTIYQSCLLGYKFDPAFWRQGYATEGIQCALSVVFHEMGLHRVEALVLPENTPSIRLLDRLGFTNEGVAYSCIYLHGAWRDHLRFSLIHP